MKTGDLLDLLAADSTPVDRNGGGRRFQLGLACGGLAAALMLIATLGIRADLGTLALIPKFWLKLGFPAALAVAGLAAAYRLSIPGRRLGTVWSWIAFVGIWYVLGMAIPTVAGALLGPRVLHW